jgi:hypothetical protein
VQKDIFNKKVKEKQCGKNSHKKYQPRHESIRKSQQAPEIKGERYGKKVYRQWLGHP